jgi:hypothetical protein
VMVGDLHVMTVIISPKGNPVANKTVKTSKGAVMIQLIYREYQIARVPSRRMVVLIGVLPRFEAKAGGSRKGKRDK